MSNPINFNTAPYSDKQSKLVMRSKKMRFMGRKVNRALKAAHIKLQDYSAENAR